ncbi:DUF4263 domain-containing protein [Nocardioides sp. S-58]|uniref:DUF4263 domain-containing protein n=1 Tax=Nocardioides renjunii TaxID=3095075 RepID=A0ABU5K8Y8_9ACTN|nr:Shedu anti-phage system protein SduA domain-containing protein [Nocardioides sp. S-58]MDZ5661408.1 DUF4263 domain-containing protein [Nocardioides sp. S-58]
MSEIPRWQQVAEQLERLLAGPTKEQFEVAEALEVTLPRKVPAPVAAVILKQSLSDVIFEGAGRASEIPDLLTDLEDQLGLAEGAVLVTGTDKEVSAWIGTRFMMMTARGLRKNQPAIGDIVSGHAWEDERRLISSIGDDGRVYMKGRPPRRAWPNHLDVVTRVGDPGYAIEVAEIEATIVNGASYKFAALDRFDILNKYLLPTHVPEPEAVRALEDLLDSGETREEPFQKLVTRYPALLAATVVGGWRTYVLPKPRLGSELVPDFLVLGLNSNGPQWLLVEIEATRHKILNQDDTISTPVRHAVKQVQDWREWLTTNVMYAHTELHLYGLTNQAPGLVVIGRDDPRAERQASRAVSEEGARTAIHSWDWILRCAQNLSAVGTDYSNFAKANAADNGVSRSPAERVPGDLEQVVPDLDRWG